MTCEVSSLFRAAFFLPVGAANCCNVLSLYRSGLYATCSISDLFSSAFARLDLKALLLPKREISILVKMNEIDATIGRSDVLCLYERELSPRPLASLNRPMPSLNLLDFISEAFHIGFPEIFVDSLAVPVCIPPVVAVVVF